MRRLAQGITGALAMAFMVLRQPWDLRDCPAATCSHSSDETLLWVVLGGFIYVGMVAVIMTVVLVGVLGIRDSERASDSAVLSALGQSQRSAVKAAALRGLTDGAVATGVVFVITGALNVWIVLSSGYGWDAISVYDYVARLVFAIGFTAMLTLAHVIDAVRPHRTPVERLHEDAAPPRPRRVSLALRALVLAWVLAIATGVLVGTAVTHDIAEGDAGTLASLLAQVAVTMLTLAGIALFFAVGVPLLREAMPSVLGAAARVTGAVRATHAAAVLRARAATASGVSARTVLAIAGLALLAGSLATANPAPAFAPTYLGAVTAQPAGISEDLAREYATVDGVGAVVVGTASQVGDGVVVGIDAADLAGVDDQLGALLAGHPGALVSSELWDGLSVGDYAGQGLDVTGIVPTSTCCTQIVDINEVPVTSAGSAVLIWAEPGADPAAVGAAVDGFTPTTAELAGWGMSLAQGYENADTGGWVLSALLIVVVCIGPVVALAYGVVSRRRRDDATLAALGASRRSLTAAAVVETTAIAAVAVAGGLLGGALLHAALTAAGRAEDSLRGVITDSYLEVMVRSVAWPTLGWMFVVAVAAFAAVALVVKLAARGSLPAEELRAAQAEVLS